MGNFLFLPQMDESNFLEEIKNWEHSPWCGIVQFEEKGRRNFLGESGGSHPPPQDSHPDAGEAINDFWSMSGNFKNRHHVEPRVNLYSPREESFPIPLKYIDVSTTTRTNLDVIKDTRAKRIPSWMSKHPIFRYILQQLHDDHRFSHDPFGALAEFRVLLHKANKMTKRDLSTTNT